ncbi:hypothetical protein PMAYCL1PPCAC_28090, partial [Pristionchus mayeri]
ARLRKNRTNLRIFGNGQKSQILETLVLKGADEDRHIHFARGASVGSRRRVFVIKFYPGKLGRLILALHRVEEFMKM